MTPTCAALPDVTADQRARILAAPRTPAAHRALLADLPAMSMLEVGMGAGQAPLPATFGVAAWNLERCLFPERSAALLAPFAPRVVLLSEVDNGMARSEQRNTTAAMAAAMGMHHTFGLEFYEMGLGGPTELHLCTDDYNRHGWHGNGILSAAPFQDLALIRLDDTGHWFRTDADSAASAEQPRVGGRMAIAAVIDTTAGPICAVSTHLESNAGAALRHAQTQRLLDAIDGFAPGLPVIIGGDLNTGNHIPPNFDWRAETLFELAEGRGYTWALTPPGDTTRPSLITPHPTRKMKLDWFAQRGLLGDGGTLIPATDSEGTLSDHECIIATVTRPASPGAR